MSSTSSDDSNIDEPKGGKPAENKALKRHKSEDSNSDDEQLKLAEKKSLKGNINTEDSSSDERSKPAESRPKSLKRHKNHEDTLQEKYLRTDDKISSVVASHYNKLEEKGLENRNMSRIVYMRNFNNWVKSNLILRFMEKIKENSPDEHRIIAVDLGCGKGGDLFKWQKSNIRHLICVDIAATSISQCQQRYDHIKNKGSPFSAEFIVADYTNVNLKKHVRTEKLADIVSCQFSFHYSFKSLSAVETTLKNISSLLRKKGYFIATIPDANKIVSALRESDSNSFMNEVYKIEFPEDRPKDPPLFGDTYNFYLEGVVNCPEFLVHFPTLVRLCKKYGMELEYKKSFEDLYNDGVNDRESRSLLFKMKALEMYPSMHGCSLSSSLPEEYDHAEEYMKETDKPTVKTLSRSEWEAICLYMAFAFKKVA